MKAQTGARRPATDAWAELAAAARPERSSSRRRLVPVLGSGVLMQAFHEGMDRGERTPLDWAKLLLAVAEDAGLSRPKELLGPRDVPGQGTLVWESMILDRVAKSPAAGAAHLQELALRRLVARRLVEHADARAARERCQPFVDRLLGLGWEDVVTFDFDDWLCPGASLVRGVRARPALHVERGATRVWHPHGYARRPESIVLGARAYGVVVSELATAFDRAVARTRRADGSEGPPRTVVDAVLERPLLLAGLSLTREEWSIWWLLTQRARYLARRPKRPPVFVLARRPAPDDPVELHASFASLHRHAALLDLRLLETSSWSDGWKKVGTALGMPPKTRARRG